MRGKDRDTILGLRPRRIQTTARGRRKGPLRVPQPLTRAAASPAARPEDAAAFPAARPGGAAAARGVTRTVVLRFRSASSIEDDMAAVTDTSNTWSQHSGARSDHLSARRRIYTKQPVNDLGVANSREDGRTGWVSHKRFRQRRLFCQGEHRLASGRLEALSSQVKVDRLGGFFMRGVMGYPRHNCSAAHYTSIHAYGFAWWA
ncbi:hypothetical protein NDU88_005997 [Pleurodeles waltl]|uniref:Uncharacterized protein n=1 Tax=Pleurodeles waltl TaxID=8319 RepID=A0AAV7TDU6_PLEWA|nr:hypothetical protein NDU88_005997 [Pleurodeles waltl]